MYQDICLSILSKDVATTVDEGMDECVSAIKLSGSHGQEPIIYIIICICAN